MSRASEANTRVGSGVRILDSKCLRMNVNIHMQILTHSNKGGGMLTSGTRTRHKSISLFIVTVQHTHTNRPAELRGVWLHGQYYMVVIGTSCIQA